MIDLKVELRDQLCIEGFTSLADGTEGAVDSVGQLLSKVGARQSEEFEKIMHQELVRQLCANIAFATTACPGLASNCLCLPHEFSYPTDIPLVPDIPVALERCPYHSPIRDCKHLLNIGKTYSGIGKDRGIGNRLFD